MKIECNTLPKDAAELGPTWKLIEGTARAAQCPGVTKSMDLLDPETGEPDWLVHHRNESIKRIWEAIYGGMPGIIIIGPID
ncbi:MAG: hypothetical protein ABII07_01350 [Patescibacteria group bacterium]|nr:hypothetical protein [Patescibacteria group bacterium]